MRRDGDALRQLIDRFIHNESTGGMLLVAATVLALLWANGAWAGAYFALLDLPLAVSWGGQSFGMSLLHWMNDGLMVLFFYVVGLELKRELAEGELADRRRAALPAFAALGGMICPALIYTAFTWGDPIALRGWAIPAATDIAFALGVMSLLGSRVPSGLKIFLVSLAIMDDLGAILIIALFYSHGITPLALGAAALCVASMAYLNRRGVAQTWPYILLSVALWLAVLLSGIHATIAGVLAAFCLPLRAKNRHGESPAKAMETRLHPWVAFAILPAFALLNAGVPLDGLHWADLNHPVLVGIMLALLIGKQVGVFGFAWLAVKTGLGKLPERTGWQQIHAAAVLCGIGFTMSLFIAGLAFGPSDPQLASMSRLGILLGSSLSAVLGYFLLRRSS